MLRLLHSRWTRTIVLVAALALVLSPLVLVRTHAAVPSQVSQIPGLGSGKGPNHPPKPAPHPNARPAAARPNAAPTWVQMSASNPFTFTGGLVMATNPVNHTVVLYLPSCGPRACAASSQTWVWNGSAWTQANGTQPTPARDRPGMSFDPSTGKVMLFGGLSGNLVPGISPGAVTGNANPAGTVLNDTWEFDGTNWSQVVTNSGPSPRYNVAMAPAHGGVLLMGGNVLGANTALDDPPGISVTGDTWFWNGHAWSQVCPTSILPSPRQAAGMATPPGSVIPILFGGRLGRDPLTGLGEHGLSAETFVANFNGPGVGAGPSCGWNLQKPSNGPTLAAGPEAVPAQAALVPHGVVNGQPVLGPQPREPGGFAATNTPANGILMFSGESFDDESGPNTWEYVPTGTPQWQELEVASNPATNQPLGARIGQVAMATDPNTGTPLLVESGGTWRWAH